MKVLIAEDDVELLDLLTYALRREGYGIVGAIDGQQALNRMESDEPDFVLLDVNLPKLNGFEVCRHIRNKSNVPIIMVTGLDEEEHVLRGLRVGADDYVTKPFSAKELSARMRAVLRRSQSHPNHEPQSELRIGDLVLDLQSHEARRGDRAVQLTRLEFRIIYILAMNPGRVIPYSRLVEYAWGYDGGDSSLLKTHICHIRDKLCLSTERDGIRAVPGVGYSLAAA